MSKSVEKLVEAARQCFFQHGYSAANVSLIGRYAGISRATIYKNFSSKEALLRAVMQQHIDFHDAALVSYQASEQDFWDDTERLVKSRCQGVFDEINSSLIRSELIHAGQIHCHDLIEIETEKVQSAIETRLEREIANSKVVIAATGLTPKRMTQVIESVPIGIAFSSVEDNTYDLVTDMFAIFKASAKT